jgi:tetratricopeptide (TPR) repeat protein
VGLLPTFDRRTMIGLSIAGLIPAFALTHLVVARYRASRQQLAAEWSARGLRDFPGEPHAAVVDFETALAFAPERSDDRLRLGEALMRANQPAEARAQLLTLWAEQPGSGRINLNLARLSAAAGDVQQAVRYYHAAVDGSWESGAPLARRTARLEAAKLLLAHGERLRAQSELIALIEDLPNDSSLMTSVAGLLVDAGADVRARALLDRALAVDPANATAARLAGGIAFRRGDYRAAREFLRTAHASDPVSTDMLAVSEQVLALDPYARGVRSAERAKRALRSLEIARDRLQRCQGPPPASPPPQASGRFADLVDWLTTARMVSARTVARDAEALDDIMNLVFDVEKIQDAACGPALPSDRALSLIAAQRSGRAQ